jgi:hypothetical protein
MAIPDMGPRPMTKVMTKSSQFDTSYMLILDAQGRLTLLKVLSHNSGKMTNAYPRKIASAETSAQIHQHSHRGSARTYCEMRRETHSMRSPAALRISTVESEACDRKIIVNYLTSISQDMDTHVSMKLQIHGSYSTVGPTSRTY